MRLRPVLLGWIWHKLPHSALECTRTCNFEKIISIFSKSGTLDAIVFSTRLFWARKITICLSSLAAGQVTHRKSKNTGSGFFYRPVT